MQNYADYADELIEQIDSDELAPEEVDIRPFVENETDVLTPELAERLPDSKIAEYNARVAERDQEELAAEQRETTEDHAEALDRLRDPDADVTETAELLTGTELPVKTHTNGRIDRKIMRMDQAETPQEVIEDIIEVICWFVEDDEFADPALWQDYAEEYGAVDLMKEAIRIMAPYRDGFESDPVVQRFRGE